jgi:hypothetical protein
MSTRAAVLTAVVLAGGLAAACSPETTSFRPTDRIAPQRLGPPSTGYEVYLGGQLIARAHVWSNGGYMSSGDDPMTHVGFEINSATMRPLTFDADALELVVFGDDGQTLPPARFSSITPLGPSMVTVPPAATVMIGAYFLLPVRPRGVDSMQVRWTVRCDTDEYRQITGFVRDDDAPFVERMPAAKRAGPSS